MERFAFIIHPIDVRRDVARRYPIAQYVPERLLEWYVKKHEPIVAAHITGIRSATGAEAEGWFVGCPLTPRQFLTLPEAFIYGKLEECGHIAEDLGAGIVGLGAFSSVAGDGGITLAKRLRIAVTTGNSYTVATAIQGAVEAAGRMGISLLDATVAIVGATGSIGATCAQMMARQAHEVALIGRNLDRLNAVATRLQPTSRAHLSLYTDVAQGLREADVVITVSNAAEAIIQPSFIKRGAVVCDVARPRDVSVAVARERDDVLVIEGGVVSVPGNMQCHTPRSGTEFTFGFPQGTAYACMSETIALALEGRYESFTLGKEVSVAQVDEISALCARHGFELSGFRSFERAVTEEEIARIRSRAGRTISGPTPLPGAPATGAGAGPD